MEHLLVELQNPNPEARLRAIRRLRLVEDARAVTALTTALDDPVQENRARAAIALGQMNAREAVPALIERLKSDPSDEAREICAFALIEIGDTQAVQPLIDALRDPSERVTALAAIGLSRLGDPLSVEPIIGLLDHSSREGAEERRAVFQKAMVELQDPDPKTRTVATSRLGALGGAEAVAALRGALKDTAGNVRARAAMHLGQTLQVQEAIPDLIQHLLHDDEGDVRAHCAWALARLGGHGVEDALRQALRDSDRRVLMAACFGTERIGDRRAIPVLLPLLEHSERSVRYNASRALLTLRAADQRLVSALEKLAQNPEAEEHDLEVDEWNYDLRHDQSLASDPIEPQPQERLKMRQLVEQARQLLAHAET